MEKFKIHNGRGSFYQWDYDQRLAVLDDTVTEVHIPLGAERCPPLPVYEHEGQRVVDIPNALLQTPGMKRVYAFVEDVFGGRTICAETFRVNERPKPDDYVYTEEERWTAKAAVEKALQAAKENGDFKGEPGPKGDPGAVKYVVVTQLPATDTENAIYLVPTADSAEDNLFDEYIYVDGAWEKIGSSTVAVDLADYVKNTDYPNSTVKAGVVKVNPTDFGIGAYPTTGILYITPADKNEIDKKSHVRRPIVPGYLDYAVKKGLADSKEEWTEDEKASARALVGAVGSTDYATQTTAGVVIVPNNNSSGLYCGKGELKIYAAQNVDIDAKKSEFKPLVPKYLDYAVKVGMTTNALEWTDDEKKSARDLFGAVGNTEVANNTLGLVRIGQYGTHGLNINQKDGLITVAQATTENIDNEVQYKPITPYNLKYAVKVGLTTNTETLTDEEKAAACSWMGAVGSTDIATSSKAGLVRVHGSYGLQLYGDLLVTVAAENSHIDAKSHGYYVITPKNLDYAVKSALTTNTITLTDEEKAAVRAWLGID